MNVLAFLLSPFVYFLSLIFPKKESCWCFGSWFGKRYSDNTKFLYEKALLDESINAVWITSNKSVYTKLKSEGKPVEYYLSLKGILAQMRSKVFVCTVNSKDFYFASVTFRNTIVQLWHGSPFKKIGFDVECSEFTKILNVVRSKLIDNYSYIVSPSEFFDDFFMSAFNLSAENIVRSNYPRCDAFSISDKRREEIRNSFGIGEKSKFVIYMPTHRNEGKDIAVIKEVWTEIQRNFKGYSESVVGLKLHPYDLKFSKDLQIFNSNCFLVDSDEFDVYEILAASDALITDYSSVMFDYAVLGKAIFLLTPDYVDYKNKIRGVYFDITDLCWQKFDEVPQIITVLNGVIPSKHELLDSAKYIVKDASNSQDYSGVLLQKLKEKVFCGSPSSKVICK